MKTTTQDKVSPPLKYGKIKITDKSLVAQKIIEK